VLIDLSPGSWDACQPQSTPAGPGVPGDPTAEARGATETSWGVANSLRSPLPRPTSSGIQVVPDTEIQFQAHLQEHQNA
jgi:hypothetical protein